MQILQIIFFYYNKLIFMQKLPALLCPLQVLKVNFEPYLLRQMKLFKGQSEYYASYLYLSISHTIRQRLILSVTAKCYENDKYCDKILTSHQTSWYSEIFPNANTFHLMKAYKSTFPWPRGFTRFVFFVKIEYRWKR